MDAPAAAARLLLEHGADVNLPNKVRLLLVQFVWLSLYS